MNLFTKKSAAAFFLLSFSLGFLVATKGSLAYEDCPTVSGKWQRIEQTQSQQLENVSTGLSMPIMNLSQENCKIKSRTYIDSTGYNLIGEWDKNKNSFQCTLTALDKNKCETQVTCNLRVTDSKIIFEITAVDGPCKTPYDYKETAVYSKSQ